MKHLDKIFNFIWTVEELTSKNLGSKTFREFCIKYLNYDPE